MAVTLVMYHYVRDVERSTEPPVFAVSPGAFASQVEHLLRHYEPVDPDVLVAAVRTGSPLPSDGFTLSFDDGLRDHWDNVVPVLDRHGVKALFAPIVVPYTARSVPFVQKNQFVRAALGQDALPDVFVETAERVAPGADVAGTIARADCGEYRLGSPKYLRFKQAVNYAIPLEVSRAVIDHLFREHVADDEHAFARDLFLAEQQIRELAALGHAIAAHSVTHPCLPRLSNRALVHEIAGSIAWVRELTGAPPDWFAYPYGDHDPRCWRMMPLMGVAVAYSTRPSLPWSSLADRYRVPRVDTCRLPTADEVREPAVALAAAPA